MICIFIRLVLSNSLIVHIIVSISLPMAVLLSIFSLVLTNATFLLWYNIFSKSLMTHVY